MAIEPPFHWAEVEVFQETFPEINVCADRYVIDRGRITAGGASTTMDLILEIIRQHHGEQLAIEVAEFLIFDIERPGSSQQREFISTRLSAHAPRLAKSIKVMEGNIETPLTIPDLADQIGTIAPRRTTANCTNFALRRPGSRTLRVRQTSVQPGVPERSQWPPL